jgi:hypothetical protein
MLLIEIGERLGYYTLKALWDLPIPNLIFYCHWI